MKFEIQGVLRTARSGYYLIMEDSRGVQMLELNVKHNIYCDLLEMIREKTGSSRGRINAVITVDTLDVEKAKRKRGRPFKNENNASKEL